MKKIIISVYACNPQKGSERGVGWGWVKTIGKYHKVWALVGSPDWADVQTEITKNPDKFSNIHFYQIPRKRWLFLEKFWPPAYHWTYRLWLRDAYKLAVKLHREINFDLAHQLTYVGFRFPGHLWKLGIPFVWGPIGGLENTPWRFLPSLGLYGMLYYAARNIVNTSHKRFLRGPKEAFRRAEGGVIAATEGIRREIKRWYGVDSHVITEIGPPPEVAESPVLRNPGEPLRISWSGLHLPGKALHFLLRALSLLPGEINWKLDILGEGPLAEKWKKLARRLGIDKNCTWHGWLPRDEALSVVHESHIFVITSMKDLTSTVTLEALSQGVPVICPDHCGFSNVITRDCGIKIPLKNPKQLVMDMASAIEFIYNNEQDRRRLARGALLRVEEFSWERKAQQLNRIYQDVLKGRRK
ncbi:MAG: glycosyltransferase [Nitrospirae bacterium]|nr:MAG: glycosyltransferase [Nitrospirota bacterium]